MPIHTKLQKGLPIGLVILLLIVISGSMLTAQTCDCKEYLYLNDTDEADDIHKFSIEPGTGALGEIGSPWFDASGIIDNPHGIATDLNGYMYFSQYKTSGIDLNIKKISCDGTLIDADPSTTAFDNWSDDYYSFNFFSQGNSLYANLYDGNGSIGKLSLLDLCTGDELGCMSPPNELWGFSEGTDGNWYGTSGDEIWSGPINPFFWQPDANGNCSNAATMICSLSGLGINSAPDDLAITGIDQDAAGNLFVVVGGADGFEIPSTIYKIDPVNCQILASTPTDFSNEPNIGDNLNWGGARGLVYSESADVLYVSSSDDCIAAFDPSTLNYLSAISIHTPQGAYPKAIEIVSECCPLFESLDIDTVYCGTPIGEDVFMIDFLPCDFICAGQWSVVSSDAGTFNSCNNSFTLTQFGTGCISYDYVPDANNPNSICAEFHINICIEFTDAPEPPAIGLSQPDACGNRGVVVESFCETGNFVEFSTNMGDSWSTNFPANTGSDEVFVIARCVDPDRSCASEASNIVTLPPFMIPGFEGEVFVDNNNNGCRDNGDAPVSGVDVYLYECTSTGEISNNLSNQTAIASVTTTSDGSYDFSDFCVNREQEYVVVFDIPHGYVATTQNSSSCTDDFDSDSDNDGVTECHDPNDPDGPDLGVDPCLQISGEVFVDENSDGCQDASEPSVANITVSLFECDAFGNVPSTGANNPINTVQTGQDGEYVFDECLDPDKTYYVDFNIPNGFQTTIKDANNCDDSIDSDVNFNGQSDCVDPEDPDGPDLGIEPCPVLTGVVFIDVNGNGCNDNNDPPVPNVMVALYECDVLDNIPANGTGNAISTVATDQNGTYSFMECLDPNKSYYVDFDIPDDYQATEQNSTNCNDSVDSDANADGQSDCIDPSDPDGPDLGIEPCPGISGQVFLDENSNGCLDTDETKVSNITVTLYECDATGNIPSNGSNTAVSSTTTTPGGEYNFAECLDPDKTYYIVFDIPDGFRAVAQNSTNCTDDNDSDVDTDGVSECIDPDDPDGPDLGIEPCPEFSGEVFFDENGNGCKDVSEIPVPNITVRLYECDEDESVPDDTDSMDAIVSVITDENGGYTFSECLDPDKTYYVDFDLPAGFRATVQNAADCSDDTDSDVNQEGKSECRDPEDPDGPDVGIEPCPKLSGEVFIDDNADGCNGDNDTGFGDVAVTLYECDADGNIPANGTAIPRSTTSTNPDGSYQFAECLDPDKTYYVSFDIPEGFAASIKDSDQCDDSTDSDTNSTGDSQCIDPDDPEGPDLGLVITSSLGNFVFLDNDGDGIQDTGEPGVENIIVNLYDDNDNLLEITVTDPSGFYIFDDLYPGNYYVEFILPSDYEFTFPFQGFNNSSDSNVNGSNGAGTTDIINLGPGENDLTIDAGVYICVPVGDLVWYDTNINDVWDSVENGINGLKVTLFRWVDGSPLMWEETFTSHKPGSPSDDGYFKFCAPPGDYFIEFSVPSQGLVPTKANIGNDEEADSDVTDANGLHTTNTFTLTQGNDKCDIGAGYYPMASVGDHVWYDDNFDGLRQATEAPAQGVTIEAYDLNNNMVASAQSDISGSYYMDYLKNDAYYLKFYPPTGYTMTSANMGSDDTKDSDVSHNFGANTTSLYNLTSGNHTPNVDAGFTSGVLPVELVSFNVINNGHHNEVMWETANEVNLDYFVIQRSFGEPDKLGQVAKIFAEAPNGQGAQYLELDDDIANAGEYFYRLEMVDLDGTISYSKIINVTVDKKITLNRSVTLYPNPTHNDVTISLDIPSTTNVSISLLDTKGKVVMRDIVVGQQQAGLLEHRLSLDELPSGIYNFRILLDNRVLVRKLMIVRE